ncbi:MAG: hypothetical protein PUP93_30380 [Rhizonema sp. NSF051]|nr:hypothetical protein [Rhizonema sp. NSF051]
MPQWGSNVSVRLKIADAIASAVYIVEGSIRQTINGVSILPRNKCPAVHFRTPRRSREAPFKGSTQRERDRSASVCRGLLTEAL